MGHLYIRVETFVREREGRPGVGMIEQSLCHHLQSQLTEYYKLIAILESQMGFVHKTDDPKSPSPLDLVDVREEETGLTLKRLDVWINEWRLRMRMMSVCVEGAKGNIIVLLQSRVRYEWSKDRHPWRGTRQHDTWVYRQRGPVYSQVH